MFRNRWNFRGFFVQDVYTFHVVLYTCLCVIRTNSVPPGPFHDPKPGVKKKKHIYIYKVFEMFVHRSSSFLFFKKYIFARDVYYSKGPKRDGNKTYNDLAFHIMYQLYIFVRKIITFLKYVFFVFSFLTIKRKNKEKQNSVYIPVRVTPKTAIFFIYLNFAYLIIILYCFVFPKKREI